MVNKNNNKGAAFTIVIIAMALFITIMFTVSFQTNYQINTNYNHYINLQQKYLAESGIDKVIADISSGIEQEIKDTKKSYSVNSMTTYSSWDYSHEGHTPASLENNEINDIGSNLVNSKISNPLKDMNNKFLDINNTLQNNDIKNGISQLAVDTKQIADNIDNTIGSSGDRLIGELWTYVNSKKITDRNDQGYQDRVKVIESYIDERIKDISSLQKRLKELYNNSQNNDENLRRKIDEIQSTFESSKYYLEEIKCKLGIKITGNTEEDNNDNSGSSGSSETITINVHIPNYKFPSGSSYKSDGYETNELNIPVTVNYTNGSISSIEPVTVNNIISTGYKNNEEYQMSANITFNIGKIGNDFRILSYRVNEWKKI